MDDVDNLRAFYSVGLVLWLPMLLHMPIHIEQAFYTAAFSWRYLFPGGTRTGQKNVLWLRSGIKGPLLPGLSPSSSTAWSRA